MGRPDKRAPGAPLSASDHTPTVFTTLARAYISPVCKVSTGQHGSAIAVPSRARAYIPD